jgi:beta-lactamase class A
VKQKAKSSSSELNSQSHNPTTAKPKSPIRLLPWHKSSSVRRSRKPSAASNQDMNPNSNTSTASQELKSVPPRRRRRRNKQSLGIVIPTPFKIVLRLVIITVGISTILGSAIAIANSLNQTNVPPKTIIAANTTENQQQLEKRFSVVTLGNQLGDLTARIQKAIAEYSQLQAEVFIVDLDRKNYVNLQSTESIAAASTIKLPVLIAFFQDVDARKIDLEDKLTMTEAVKAGGSGGMQYQAIGSKFSALYTATQMMVTSDNTATNMIIERLGGQEKLNQRFAEWGLNFTKLRNPLPDLAGTNTTNAEELGKLLMRIERGELVSWRSRDRLLAIMRQVQTNTLLPKGLEPGATIAHKTGDIASVLADAGIIDLPNGKRYIAAVLVKRPSNDPQAKTLIQKISQITYQYFKLNHSGSFLQAE